jgi:hypothetical protein
MFALCRYVRKNQKRLTHAHYRLDKTATTNRPNRWYGIDSFAN